MEIETLYGTQVAHCKIRQVRGGTIVSNVNGHAIMTVPTDKHSTVFGYTLSTGREVRNGNMEVMAPLYVV